MLLLLLSSLLTALSISPTQCAIGTWDLKASDQVIFRFEISTTSTDTKAMWERPENFDMDGESFSSISGTTVRRLAHSVKIVGGDVELNFDDPTPGATPDIFRLHCVGLDHLKVAYQGTGFERFDFVREHAKQPPLGPWDEKRNYVRNIIRSTNVEMTTIFESDQADRQVANIDWSVVALADEKRQNRTQVLLDADALQSGDDFYHAAFVFQHGRTAGDYLKAHLLAMIATARGKPEALWIASATLDRYLQSIGKPQVLGTQYTTPKNAPATQEPYNRLLVSDAMRKALHVPSLSEQEEERQEYTAKALRPKKP
jgi:hypothetical protein